MYRPQFDTGSDIDDLPVLHLTVGSNAAIAAIQGLIFADDVATMIVL